MTADEFSNRLWEFAAQVAHIVDDLPGTRSGRHVAGQLIRSGTSAAPNYDEACVAESRADFAHKAGIAAKEMRETCGWLKFIIRTELDSEDRVGPLLLEAIELVRMLSKSASTARRRKPEG